MVLVQKLRGSVTDQEAALAVVVIAAESGLVVPVPVAVPVVVPVVVLVAVLVARLVVVEAVIQVAT